MVSAAHALAEPKSAIWNASAALSAEAAAIGMRLRPMIAPSEAPPPLSHFLPAPTQTALPNRKLRRSRPPVKLGETRFSRPKPLAERARESLLELRRRTAQVGMYLDESWRLGLDRQLEFMLAPDEWPEDAALPNANTYMSFLRLIVLLKPHRRPSLGVSDFGSIMATWDNGDAQLYVEFAGGETIRWSAYQVVNATSEVTSGQTVIERLPANLAAYAPDRWFAVIG